VAPRRSTPGRGDAPLVTRRHLARVRDVMAGPGSAEQRLNMLTDIIATDMVAEVCSVYVRRPGDVLELYATKGLKPEAVHHTRLNFGEGLIGEIAAGARPFALADAQEHPSFAYRPETGEEIYFSLMGVPILRGGRVIGVLAVQNRTRRQYTDEEVETLQTIAMVLAELVAGGEMVRGTDEMADETRVGTALRLEGLKLNAGIGMGQAALHERDPTVENLVAENPEVEHVRLNDAFTGMHGALDDMLGGVRRGKAGEHVDILESYRMIAEDAGWLTRMREAIDTGLTAEAAVLRVRDDIRARMSRVSDPYLRERVHDFDDLANRLLRHLLGVDRPAERDIPENAILIARSMGPAELLDYPPGRLKGLVLEEGSALAHVAIVARALEIPVVGGASGVIDRVEPGDAIIVDGDNGQVVIRPGEDLRRAYAASLQALAEQKARYAALKDRPTVTRDGERIELNINAGLMIDLAHLKATGADGIGLFRTEILFMTQSEFPDPETQRRLYERIIDEAGPKPVAFRTLDVGGDKALPYWRQTDENNPALGWRAIRVLLDHPVMLRRQLRALIRAARGRPLRLMFPMIAEVAELDHARDVLAKELERQRDEGEPLPEKLEVGAMLEVPGLLFQLPALLKRVDFLSVGSNDLAQFLFASDRTNPRLAERYDELSPAMLEVLSTVVRACDAAKVPVSVCGEMAGRPLDAMALIGLGFKSLSMATAAVGPVKEMLLGLDLGPLREYLKTLADHPAEHSLREMLKDFARDHGIAA
jgi:phosphotransferase system enzyme I (PtsP)